MAFRSFRSFRSMHALVVATAIIALSTGVAHSESETPSPRADQKPVSLPALPPNRGLSEGGLPKIDLPKIEEPASPISEAELEWSENPGVYESDLYRRFGNPLYLESRRQIGELELLEAKRRDAEKMWTMLESFIGLLADKKRMSRFELASQMGDALLRIDEGTWNALRVGGEAYPLAAAIQELRTWLLNEWRVSSAADPGVRALLKAEARIPSVKTESLAIRFLALIQLGDGDLDEAPIRRYEFGPALMSEEPAAIRKVYHALRGELKFTMEKQLTLVLDEIARTEIEFPDKDQKVAVVMGLLGLPPAGFKLRERSPSY